MQKQKQKVYDYIADCNACQKMMVFASRLDRDVWVVEHHEDHHPEKFVRVRA